jgi:heparanase 1
MSATLIDIKYALLCKPLRRCSLLLSCALSCTGLQNRASAQVSPSLHPGSMPRVGTVDERFQSYNIEMLEVTGGRFWKPYNAAPSHPISPVTSAETAGADRYAYRPPKDLSNPRLRVLAKALAPAYVRVSGTWANTTYLPNAGETSDKPPAGFDGVLTRAQWKAVVDFAHATDADIMTSFATSAGTRDANGMWTAAQAQGFADYTRSVGGRIAAAEYMNEPNFAMLAGAPKDYTAQDYGRDYKTFREFAAKSLPGTVILGPSSVGETTNPGQSLGTTMPGYLASKALLEASVPATVDVFSYHFYGGASKRCGSQRNAADALSEEWLARTNAAFDFYRGLRDQFAPGKPMWISETGETACGGDPWASTFLDSFRYLNQLGSMAHSGVQVIAHNTLAASDYALLDENTYAPRPNYWAALLWRRLMGTTVLEAGVPIQLGLHVYAHCLRNKPGGVALLVIQNDRTSPRTLEIPIESERYTLSARSLEEGDVLLNQTELTLSADDLLPELKSVSIAKGSVSFAPATITFLAMPNASNAACR